MGPHQERDKGDEVMAYDAEGSVYIPLEEFWIFAMKYLPKTHAEFAFGKPRIVDDDIVFDYAASTVCNPKDWAEKPKAITSWDENHTFQPHDNNGQTA
jgi:hypothetical protein